jgi:peptidoglycan/LPS O-acetylase OafA/YrhL
MTSNKNHIAVMDGLRGFAALYVMVGHAIWLLALPTGAREGREGWEWVQVALAFSFRYGHEMVMLFFVLSGFMIHLRLAEGNAKSIVDFDWRDYAQRRFWRIYPPFFFSLFSAAFWDYMGRTINPAFYAGGAPQNDLAGAIINPQYSFQAFISNIFFLQALNRIYFGTTWVVWSLNMEVEFYVMYAIVFVPAYLRLGRRWAFASMLALSLISLWNWELLSVFTYFLLWGLGAFLAELWASGRQYILLQKLIYLIPVPVSILMIVHGTLPPFVGDLLWSMIWVIVIWGLLVEKSALVQFVSKQIEFFNIVAPFSYTLFLIHLPFLICLSAIYLSVQTALPRHFGLVIFGIVFSLMLGKIFGNYIEKIKPATRIVN